MRHSHACRRQAPVRASSVARRIASSSRAARGRCRRSVTGSWIGDGSWISWMGSPSMTRMSFATPRDGESPRREPAPGPRHRVGRGGGWWRARCRVESHRRADHGARLGVVEKTGGPRSGTASRDRPRIDARSTAGTHARRAPRLPRRSATPECIGLVGSRLMKAGPHGDHQQGT